MPYDNYVTIFIAKLRLSGEAKSKLLSSGVLHPSEASQLYSTQHVRPDRTKSIKKRQISKEHEALSGKYMTLKVQYNGLVEENR